MGNTGIPIHSVKMFIDALQLLYQEPINLAKGGRKERLALYILLADVGYITTFKTLLWQGSRASGYMHHSVSILTTYFKGGRKN